MRRVLIAAAAFAALAFGLTAASGEAGRQPFSASSAAPAQGEILAGFRRLNETQYRNSIAQIFGPDIVVSGRFEPETRVAGLLASGSSVLSITPAGFKGYFDLADSIAGQVVSAKHRQALIPCAPKSAKAPDRACAAKALGAHGRLLFRRPLTAAELKARVDLASRLTLQTGSFYAGLSRALASELAEPEFLFRVETAVDTPQGPTLDAYSRAQRISFLLWDAPPDAELLRAAEAGELEDPAGLGRQVDRMMASPRLDGGMRAFFSDMLQLDGFDTLSKDAKIYPNFNAQVAASAKEETLRVITDLTLRQNGDYRDLLTTRRTFLDRTLAVIYKAPYTAKSDWAPYEFPPDAGRSGLLTQTTFLALNSQPGRSSPTERGVAFYEIFMCSPTPPPPADVDFSDVTGPNAAHVSFRERLLAHARNPGCASCHTRVDPVGLSLENFDSIGQYRTQDGDGFPIDASATIEGKAFTGAVQLGQILHDNPRVPACLARDLFAYGSGLAGDALKPAQYAGPLRRFADNGYQLRVLLRALLTDPSFYAAMAKPAGAESALPPAGAASP